MFIEIEFNKPLDQKVLGQIDSKLLKKDFTDIYKTRKTIIILGEFKIEANKLLLYIHSRKYKDVYCVFNMADVKYFIVKQI